jgi:hypothetical protein
VTVAVIIIAIIVGLIIGACWVGTKAGSGPKDSPHPCGTYGPERPGRTLVSMALDR